MTQWNNDVLDAPRNEPIVIMIDGDEVPAIWSERRICMLGPRAGECGEGWATPPGFDVDPNLPLSGEVTAWRELTDVERTRN